MAQNVARRERRDENYLLGLTNMPGDELGHLEHADLALAIEDGPERIVRIDLSSFGLVLKTVLLDVVPKLLGELGTG